MQWLFTILSVLVFINRTIATDIHYCNATVSCPESAPCCSQSGECGSGQYCIGNCDPRFSYSLNSCMPDPVCKDSHTSFKNYSSKILDSNTFLGNASAAEWTYNGYIMDYDDEDSLILAMPKNSGGTVLSSTNAIWYGKVSATLKTSHRAGVITAFILFSGVQDEIDFEWVGSDLNTTQTNFYWNGLLNWNNSANISTDDTFENFHTYEIDWHEDYITWSVDGVIGRTLYKNQTYNSTSDLYNFPQTPSKVDISIWPGGNATNANGTIAWAGGLIDWDAEDITDTGYYYAILKEVNITCYGAPSGTKKNGTSSYVYTSEDEFVQKDVAITNKTYVLGSYEGTGDNPNKGVTSSSSSSSSSSTSSVSSSTKKSSTSKGSSTITSSSQTKTSSSSKSDDGQSSTANRQKSVDTSMASSSSNSNSNTSSNTNSSNVASLFGINNIYIVFSIVLGYIL